MDNQRLAAELDRNDIELRRGEHSDILDELVARAAALPLDERLAGQVMLALYRCGRQADALGRYRQIRLRLADDLGVDPSPPLGRPYHRIMAGRVRFARRASSAR
jgi:DNA-binding SARP family transcriptional activator